MNEIHVVRLRIWGYKRKLKGNEVVTDVTKSIKMLDTIVDNLYEAIEAIKTLFESGVPITKIVIED